MKAGLICLLPLFFAFTAEAGSGNVGDNKTYPAFQAGVTGAWVRIEPGHKMIVERVDGGSPAEDRLKPGDRVLAANGRAIEGLDPRVPLGTAVTEAEAGSGTLTLSVMRDGGRLDVVVKIPVLGRYAENWPTDCGKSDKIIKAHAEHLGRIQTEEGWFDNGDALWDVMGALFLLSTGDAAYDENVERYAEVLAAAVEKNPSGSTWHLGYHLIFLSEYYLRTGDRSVLPAIEAGCRAAADGQVAGSWGHGLSGVNPGYVQSGLMNSAGVTMFLGLTLARECGVTVHEEAWQRSLVFFYRQIGHGSICYGDHRAEIYPDTNGRNAAIACAMSLLDGQVYQSAAGHLAMMVADSYASFEAGHTGGGFNVLWRGIALSHLPDTAMARAHHRQHMDQLAWYYDLCRRHDGGFSMLPSPPAEKRYTSEAWGRGLGLTYTAPRRTLRITGGPRTGHSKPTPDLEKIPWGTPRDAAFLSSQPAEGFGRDGLPPHEVQAMVESKAPVAPETLARLMRHFNPYIRTRAALKLGGLNTDAAYEAIEAALKDPDPRVRRAGCDAIAQYNNWRRGDSTAIPRNVVSERFASPIEKMLDDPDAAWWEIDGAFGALRAAAPGDIRRNKKRIDRFAGHDEWYLRESSYWALVGLGKDIRGPEFLELAERYNRSTSVFERSSMNGGIDHLIRRERVELDDEVVVRYAQTIATQLHDAMLAAGYDKFVAGQEAAHRTMMVIADFKDPPYQAIAGQLAHYLEDWKPSDNQHANWLITGNKWQPGLAKIANDLGKDAGPIIEQFERCLKRDDWNPEPRKNSPQPAVRAAMRQAVDHYRSGVESAEGGASSSNLLFEETFDSGELKPLWSQHLFPAGHSSSCVKSPARAGDHSHRTILRKGDEPRGHGSKPRAEMCLSRQWSNVLDQKGGGITGGDGDERWYGLSTFIPTDWVADPRSPEIILQWLHIWGSGLSPNLALCIRGDELIIESLWDEGMVGDKGVHQPGQRVIEHDAPRVNEGRKQLASIPLDQLRGRWTDWVFHCKWSSRPDGLTEIWRDGKQIVGHRGPNCRRTDIKFEFKMGIYKWSGWLTEAVAERVIYHDEIRIGGPAASYGDVAPRGKSR